MKKINKICAYTAFVGSLFALASCSTETIQGLDPNGVPDAANYQIAVTVDQATNQWVAKVVDKNGNAPQGLMAYWEVYNQGPNKNPVTYTGMESKGIILIEGDYDINVMLGNHNGQGSEPVTATIHIDQTRLDFTPFMDELAGTWRMKREAKGHLSHGDWQANTDEFEATGMYENLVSFTATDAEHGKGTYVFDPGESGTVLCNTSVNIAPFGQYNPNNGKDYTAPVNQYEVPFHFMHVDNELTLRLGDNSFLPYVPNDQTYQSPMFRVDAISSEGLELTSEENEAWHFILCPKDYIDFSSFKVEGFNYNAANNLWKDAKVKPEYWFADSSWGQIDSPKLSVDADGYLTNNQGFSIKCPAGMGSEQWQGQLHLKSNVEVSAEDTYDFCIYILSKEDSEVTVKVQKVGDDNTFFVEGKQAFKAGGSAYTFTDLAGFDGELEICLDFGGNAGKSFTVGNIVFRKHVAEDVEEPAEGWVDPTSALNLWNSANITEFETWTSDESWNSDAVAEPKVIEGDNVYILEYSDAPGTSQWNAQVKLKTDNLVLDASKTYDFRVTMSATNDVPQATIKLSNLADNESLFTDRKDIPAGKSGKTFEFKGLTGKTLDPVMLIFDFGGTPAGTKIQIRDVIIQEQNAAE